MENRIFALIVSAGDYTKQNLINLPSWKKDMELMEYAFINGLKIPKENIRRLNNEAFVSIKMFVKAMAEFAKKINKNDTFILYFSGHGTSDGLVLSDGVVSLQSVIDFINKLPAANKVLITDACYSGDFVTDGAKVMSADMDFKDFAGKGIAVMAACAADGIAKLVAHNNYSLYTGIVSTAMLSKNIIKKGCISLNDLNEEMRIIMDSYVQKNPESRQQIIYRTNMGGTIYFKVEEYKPYETRKISYENENYKVFEVKPLSSQKYKRFAVFVMLKRDADIKNIAKYTKKIANNIKREKVYFKESDELRFGETDAKAVWCYYGKDYNDMIRHVFIYQSIWASDREMKKLYYRENKDAVIKKGIYILKNSNYELIRKIQSIEMTEKEYIKKAKELISEIVSMGEEFSVELEEICNGTISPEKTIERYAEWIREVKERYLVLTDVDMPPAKLQKWSDKIIDLAGCVLDMAVLLEENKTRRSGQMTKREIWLLKHFVGRYYECMEDLKEFE